VSIAAGPVLGGLLIAALDWRWVFLVNLPLCAIGVALTLAVIPEAPPKAKTPLDIPGQALALVAVTALVGAVIEGGRRGWGHPGPALALVFGLLAVGAFLWVEARSAHPVAPLSMFRQRAVSTAVLVGSALNFSYYGLVFVLGLYLQRAVGWAPATAGLAFLPLTATFIVSNLVSGGLVARHGSARVTTVGVLIAAAGYALTARLGAGSSFLEMLPGFLMIPGGMGLAIPALTSGLLASVDREDRRGGYRGFERLSPGGRRGRCGGVRRAGGGRTGADRQRAESVGRDRCGDAGCGGVGGGAEGWKGLILNSALPGESRGPGRTHECFLKRLDLKRVLSRRTGCIRASAFAVESTEITID
jgi:MFS family permease